MAEGSVFRRCSCVDDQGKPLGNSCPKRNRTGHGQWCYRIELPPDATGKRRPRRRGGFATAGDAQSELNDVRALLEVPERDDVAAARKVGDVIADAISAKRTMPEVEQVRRLLRANVPVLEHPTVAQWLTGWLPTKKNLARNTHRSYESHIRLYLTPYLGAVRLDKLRVAHVADMFDQIVEHNDEITAARDSDDTERRSAVKYQRPVGPTSMQRIRETLRKALNDAIRQELITFNAAKWVDMPPATRSKAVIWTPERVEHWQRTAEVPARVMVWTPEHTGRLLDHAVHDHCIRCST